MEIPFSFKLQKNGSTATTTREAFLPFLSGEKCGMGIFLKYFFSIVPSFHLQWWSYAVKKNIPTREKAKVFYSHVMASGPEWPVLCKSYERTHKNQEDFEGKTSRLIQWTLLNINYSLKTV